MPSRAPLRPNTVTQVVLLFTEPSRAESDTSSVAADAAAYLGGSIPSGHQGGPMYLVVFPPPGRFKDLDSIEQALHAVSRFQKIDVLPGDPLSVR